VYCVNVSNTAIYVGVVDCIVWRLHSHMQCAMTSNMHRSNKEYTNTWRKTRIHTWR